MTATAPRSSGRSRASRSAARPSAASGGPSACPRSAAAGRRSTAPAAPRHAAMGSLVLIDGSPFDWLGTGTPRLLLGAIDDATSTVLALHLRPAEDLHGYLTLLHRLAERHGLPVTLYGDRLGVFVRNDAHWSLEEELQGAQHPTQFGQVLRDLGIGYIAAHSPQAKGRIERLWATLQDRLVAELRLHGITTARRRRGVPAHLPRRPQPPLRPRPGRGRGRLAPAAPRSRRAAQLPLYPHRGPRQHRPPRPPLGPDPSRPARPLLRRLPRRGARVPRRPPARRLSGPPPRHGPGPGGRVRPHPPPGATPPRLQERVRGGGPRSPPCPKRASSALAALAALAQHLRRPARPHPWRQTFSRRQRERRRQETLTT